MWHANDKKSVGRNSPADYEGKRCSAVSYSTGKLGTLEKAVTLNAAHPAARGAAYLALAENARAAGDDKAARGYATVVTTLFADPALVAAAEKILKALPSEK